MAFSGSVSGKCFSVSYLAEEAIGRGQIVKLGATAGYVQLNDSAGEQCLGVALDKAAIGQAVSVCILGVCKVKIGTAGMTVSTTPTPIQGDGSGDAIDATTGDLIVGLLLETGADNDLCTCIVCHGGIY
jgi:predicted transcriptional regulator